MVKYFRDLRELHRNHENFFTAPLSTGLDTMKSLNNDYIYNHLSWFINWLCPLPSNTVQMKNAV